jgi:hypothetical protein
MKLTLLAIALASLAVGYAASGHAAATSVSLPKCPKHAPKFNSRGLTTKHFVRNGAQLARVCRYYNVNWGDSQGLWQHRLVTDPATVTGLAKAFNKLKEPRKGIFCIRNDGREILVMFGYAGSGPERVVVQESGCQFAANGWATRATTQGLQHHLRAIANG